MDLNDLQYINEPMELVLEDPKTMKPIENKNGEPWVLLVIGADHPDIETLENKNFNKQLKDKKVQRTGAFSVTAENMKKQAFDKLVFAVKGWKNITLGGEPYPYTKENCEQLFTWCPWIKEQVSEFAHDVANFMKHK